MIYGEFSPFTKNTEVAELTGADVEDVCRSLEHRRPFIDIDDADNMLLKELLSERSFALQVSGALELTRRLGETDTRADLIIWSKSGALALRLCEEYDEHAVEEAVELVETLTGSVATACYLRAVQVS